MASKKYNLPVKRELPFESIALLLQGGGALGAYQAGVYQALSEASLEPNWVAGISIGAINAAIIAGNEPGQRLSKLREFWEFITMDDLALFPSALKSLATRNDTPHQMINFLSATHTIMGGIPGFFKPKLFSPWLEPKGSIAATSFYDTSCFKSTLERMIDFDRLNNDDIQLNIGAVNVKTGNFTDFDNKTQKITPEHIMASGALPPGFPPVEIEGEYYWDGGLISNTPLHWVVEDKSYQDTLVFQVDLWSADGEFPQNMADVLTRQKDVQYSSRTRANTDRFKEQHKLCHTIASLLNKLPDELKKLPEVEFLSGYADSKVYNIVHLIYHNKNYEGYSKDFEFSRLSMEAHWQSGYNDTLKALKHPEVLERPHNKIGIAIFDFSREKDGEGEGLPEQLKQRA
jgi:NTE family protein